jgi:hypothetical protein
LFDFAKTWGFISLCTWECAICLPGESCRLKDAIFERDDEIAKAKQTVMALATKSGVGDYFSVGCLVLALATVSGI